MSTPLLQAAILGAGRIALPAHGLPLLLHPLAQTAAVCDVNETAATRLARLVNAKKVYTSAQEMLAQEKSDFVCICTPPWLHEEHTLLALEHGAAVLVEKPLTSDAAASARLTKVAQKFSPPVWVGYHKRFDAGLQHLAQELQQQTFGPCFHADFNWRGLWTVANVPAVKELKKTASALGLSTEALFPAWRDEDPRSPGATATVFCHLLDLAMAFFGQPERWHGEALATSGGKADHFVVTLRFATATATLRMSASELSFEEKEEGVFYTPQATYRYETNSNRQALLPARVWRTTARGAFAHQQEITPRTGADPRRLSAHYRKLDALIKTLSGTPPALSLTPCSLAQATVVDSIVQQLTQGKTSGGTREKKHG